MFFLQLGTVTRKSKWVNSLAVLALAAGLASCGGGTSNTASSGGEGASSAPMEKPPLTGPVALTGAGASFPAPLYQNWFVGLNQEIPDIQVNYQSVGSGAGVEQFIAGTVDFGASDVAMKDEEIAKAGKEVLMLPMTAGSIVLAYNLPGVEELKLPQDVYVDIFLGKITKWNDPKIVEANPGVELPNEQITVIHRADGSGTTGVFTQNLSAMSEEWKTKIGSGKTVQWPSSGKFLGGKGNEGVTASIQQNQGSIGYVEYGYAKNNNIPMATLQNKAGNYIKPSDESAEATLASVELPENLREFINNPEGNDSYPFVTYTWLLVPKVISDPQKAIAMEATIQYGLTKGQEQSAALGYVPLPQNVREKVASAADVITPDYQIKLQ